jgi:hypothetical protein
MRAFAGPLDSACEYLLRLIPFRAADHVEYL